MIFNWENLEFKPFKEELLYDHLEKNKNLYDNWLLYLEYQRLENLWNKYEWLIYDPKIEELLEKIWERQTIILNNIKIN